jgi:hypothetical protein
MIFKKVNKFIKYFVFLLFLTFFIFVVIEGVSSVILLTINIFTPQKLPESFHVQYDELLGWSNKPNIYVKDAYGPGIYFRTNSQSFRNNKDFTVEVPSGKIRIICSGDSNTLGVGVDNDNTWCQLLSSIDERFETINMGQGGYGIDQAYLWYMRDGRKLDHDIHIFAFIEDDFRRAKYKTFWGYQKPLLYLENDTLALDNVPVPKPNLFIPKITLLMESIKGFKVFQLLKKIKDKTGIQVLSHRGYDEQIRKLSLKIIESLHQINIEKGSTLVTMYIPIASDYTKEVPWRKFLSDELSKKGIIFIDLTDEIRKQPMHLMFSGHYTEYGNKWLANTLYEKLLSFPEIKNKLSSR